MTQLVFVHNNLNRFAFVDFMRIFLVVISVFLSTMTVAQFHTSASRSELGILFGVTTYTGDLNPYKPYLNPNLAAGILFRYNIHSRLSMRVNFLYGKVEGDDTDYTNEPTMVERNLNFSSTIYEGAVGFEFNYLPFQLGHHKYNGTAYLLAEIGLFRMNPTTKFNGNEYELQPLGTEGQGSSLTDKKNYNLIQPVIPLGAGVRLSLGERISLNFEIGIRKTFTDYLDDVGSNFYADAAVLAAENGPLAADLSNRSLSQSRYGVRGNSSTKDWYIFSGAMVTFRLGKPANCFPQ